MEVMSPVFVGLEIRPVVGDNLGDERPACVSLCWCKALERQQAVAVGELLLSLISS